MAVRRTVLPFARVSRKAPVALADGKTVRPTAMLQIESSR